MPAVARGVPRWNPSYAGRLRALGLRYTLRVYSNRKGEWRDQLDDGLLWALGPP